MVNTVIIPALICNQVTSWLTKWNLVTRNLGTTFHTENPGIKSVSGNANTNTARNTAAASQSLLSDIINEKRNF